MSQVGAVSEGLINLRFFNPREFTKTNIEQLMTSLAGGGPGMLMKIEPLVAAINRQKTV